MVDKIVMEIPLLKVIRPLAEKRVLTKIRSLEEMPSLMNIRPLKKTIFSRGAIID